MRTTVNESRQWLDGPSSEMRHAFRHHDTPVVVTCRFLDTHCSTFATPASYVHPAPVVTRLFLPLSGHACILATERKYTLTPAAIYLLPARMPFETRYECQMHAFHIHVYDETGGDLFDPRGGVLQLRDDALRGLILNALAAGESAAAEALAFVAIQKLLPAELDVLALRYARTERFRAIITEVEQRPSMELSIDTVARLVGMSASAASKAFRRATGITLKQFIVNGVIRRAKELLTYSDVSVSEIADRLKFGEVSYFSRAFKRETGMTPSKYREASGEPRARP
ncbi:MAG: helix-turn-helix transcriptional regulator [Capsulimonadaceae bacterium]|nr:helix-turn-helix transcriptional regulator [Capsulimonadaceae bacterium]